MAAIATSVRMRLHRLVDELPGAELQPAELFLLYLRSERAGRLPLTLAAAPWDDEPETEQEIEAVGEAKEDLAAGRIVSHEEARRRLLECP